MYKRDYAFRMNVTEEIRMGLSVDSL